MEAERGPRGTGPASAGQVDLPTAVETAYDEIDYDIVADIVAANIDPALDDFAEFARIYSQRLTEESQ